MSINGCNNCAVTAKCKYFSSAKYTGRFCENWIQRGIISSRQFNKETIEYIFASADSMRRQKPKNFLKDKVILLLFYEPSTRTKISFEMAVRKLGGHVISTDNAKEFSSAAKGETLQDTIRTINGYRPDAVILRHYQEGSSLIAQNHCLTPVINAGDGPGEHPTQSLLDLYTIKNQYGKIEGLNIALIGDLVNGRTVRSLCYLIGKHYPNNQIFLVSTEHTRMKADIKRYLFDHNVSWKEFSELDPIIDQVDVFYQTRIQKERFQNNLALYDEVREASQRLIINQKSLAKIKKDACVMHPLPRGPEISEDVDDDPRAIYFKQAENGLYIRMALLKLLLIDYGV